MVVESRESQPSRHCTDVMSNVAEENAALPVPVLKAFPIVGIGASAGGLDAFEAFFNTCPVDTGMAFVLISHLAPHQPSFLVDILQQLTAMPVVQVTDYLTVLPNAIYIIPPNCEMTIQRGVLRLSSPRPTRAQSLPIDVFFCSLAQDQLSRAIGVILSGTASDGTAGLAAISRAGGLCIVQEPTTAKYTGMLSSAIAGGCVRHIVPVEKMPEILQAYASGLEIKATSSCEIKYVGESVLEKVLAHVLECTGHDFSRYKKSTICRRIERRMAQNHLESMARYLHFLKQNPLEVSLLFKELLINVTAFFRDSDAFATLQHEVLPGMLADKPKDYVFRVWVAGCATGEEAYSIAILLRELMEDQSCRHNIQIYATDLDEDAVNTARTGIYSEVIEENVTRERLCRFFTKIEGVGYKVRKDIRELVVFAVQNVIKDPPFTRLDLLSCRNLMIYLESEQQQRLIPNFHYALKPGGVLFLSSSESITHHPGLFQVLSRKWKLYRANPVMVTPYIPKFKHTNMPDMTKLSTETALENNKRTGVTSIAEMSQRSLLQIFAPTSVTTDTYGNILFVHGDTRLYLSPPPGPITMNVVDMVQCGLQFDLRAAINKAGKDGTPTLNRVVRSQRGGLERSICFSVRSLPSPNGEARTEDRLLLISFEDIPEVATDELQQQIVALSDTEKDYVQQLERELAFARENLQVAIEEHQAITEELKSANEELQSTNEELQSTNEELETSKEELQSLNEETTTVNGELNVKIEQLCGMENDLKNLLDNVSTGTVFLDSRLCIRRYTREAAKVYRFITSDIGRPLGDITSNIEGEDLHSDIQGVLDTLIPREKEVCTGDGIRYLARIQPYRTIDNVIEGVVLTFTDITERYQVSQTKLNIEKEARALAEGVVNTVVEPLIVLNADLQVVTANAAYYRYFKARKEHTEGHKFYDIGHGKWNTAALRTLIENILPEAQAMENYVVEPDLADAESRRLRLNARQIMIESSQQKFILLSMVVEDS